MMKPITRSLAFTDPSAGNGLISSVIRASKRIAFFELDLAVSLGSLPSDLRLIRQCNDELSRLVRDYWTRRLARLLHDEDQRDQR